MKRLMFKTAIMIIIPIIVVSGLMVMKTDDCSKISHEVNVALAYSRIDSLKDHKKIVIIAGSNGGFGIDSKIIEDSLHLPVINTATHAGIGVRMQFEIYKELLREGDIVIFCPEYYSNKTRLYGESTLFRILSTHMPSAYFKMNFDQWINTFKYIGIHYQKARRNEECQPFDGPYSATSVNSNGDIGYLREHKEVRDKYHFVGSMDDETTSYYQYIHNYTDKNGIILIYLPPTLMESNYLDQKSQIDSLELFMQKHNIPFKAKPTSFVFNDSLFYDTPYHMTSQGASLRTHIMVEEIKKMHIK